MRYLSYGCRNRLTVGLAASFLSLFCFGGGGNLIRDDFATDACYGGFIGWNCSEADVIRLPETTENGMPIMRIWGGAKGLRMRVTTHPLHLKAGETYRLSVKVRSHGLESLQRKEFQVCDRLWFKASEICLPSDTKGKWVSLAKEVKLFDSSDGNYKCWFYFTDAIPEGGWLDVAEPRLEGSKVDDSPEYDHWKPAPGVARVSPVEPELNAIATEDAFLRFYFPGTVEDDQERRILRVSAQGREFTGRFGSDHQATVFFGSLEPGAFRMKVALVGERSGVVYAENEYCARARTRISNPTPVRRLNNFVSELADLPLSAGSYAFTLAKDGWVHISFRGECAGAVAELDGATVLGHRKWEIPETMRYLTAGSHRIDIRSDASASGRIRVRCVKDIVGSWLGRAARLERNFRDYTYGEEFFRHNGMFSLFNRIGVSEQPWNKRFYEGETGRRLMAEMRDRGADVMGSFGFGGTDLRRRNFAEMLQFVTNMPSYAVNNPMEYDEDTMIERDSVIARRALTEVWWRINDSGRELSTYFDDSFSSLYRAPSVDIPIISAFVNSGNGRARMLSEAYYRTPDRPMEFGALVDFMKRQVRAMRDMVPSAPSHYVQVLNGWMMIGGWTTWNHPEVDICAYYAKILNVLATDPEFSDIGGAGFSSPCCNEDYFRFTCDAIRYYCIEGGTGDFAAEKGFLLYPKTIANGDFRRGTEGWTLEAAEHGSLAADEIKGFGSTWQKRQFSPYYFKYDKPSPGDTFVRFMRSAKGPNRLRQKVRGLEPGRVYALQFASSDEEMVRHSLVLKDGKTIPPVEHPVLNAEIIGGDEIPDLAFVRSEMGKYGKQKVFAHRIVFRAKASEIEVVFSDWAGKDNPGGPIGQGRLVNAIGIYPYYHRDEADLRFLMKLTRQAKGK